MTIIQDTKSRGGNKFPAQINSLMKLIIHASFCLSKHPPILKQKRLSLDENAGQGTKVKGCAIIFVKYFSSQTVAFFSLSCVFAADSAGQSTRVMEEIII